VLKVHKVVVVHKERRVLLELLALLVRLVRVVLVLLLVELKTE
jgi:hypothetical protein